MADGEEGEKGRVAPTLDSWKLSKVLADYFLIGSLVKRI